LELNILNRKIIKNFAITFLIVIKIYINNFLYSKKNHQFLKNVDKIKEGNFLDFFNSTIKNNTILIFEPNTYHQECIPGFSKYFIDLGYNVDILMHELGNNCFTLFPETKSIRLRTFNNLIEIQSKAHDFSKIIKKYELILLQSSYEPNMLLYSELDVLNKNNSIFVVHDLNTVNKDFSQYFAQNRVITLGNFSKGLQVNPHYFGDIKIKDKNKKIRFFLTFTYKRNYTIFSEIVERLKSENFNFEIIIFGRTINFTSSYFPQNLNNNLKVKFRASYSEFYEAVESSDYIIVTLDPKNENDIPYKTTKVTGNIQLMYGFLKPIIINKEFAQFYDLNINNSLIYYNNSDFYNIMKKAILLDNKSYKNLQRNLLVCEKELYAKSLNNIKKFLNRN